MLIKQSEAVKAYRSVKDLNQQKLSSGLLAKRVFELFTALQSAWDFQVQEEQKIFNEHPSFDPELNGIKLTGDEDQKIEAVKEVKIINDEISKIGNLDFEINFEQFDFNLSSEKVSISGEDIGNLSLFINFIE